MERRREGLVVAIGVFKLVKAVLLVAVGAALLLELPQELGMQAERALRHLGIGAGRHTVQKLVERLGHVDAPFEKRLALFALGYAGVFTVEGVGLLLRRRWGEWLTVFVTGSFIPFEVYELIRHFGPVKLAALVLNVAIVAYLAWRRVEHRPAVARGGRAGPRGTERLVPSAVTPRSV